VEAGRAAPESGGAQMRANPERVARGLHALMTHPELTIAAIARTIDERPHWLVHLARQHGIPTRGRLTARNRSIAEFAKSHPDLTYAHIADLIGVKRETVAALCAAAEVGRHKSFRKEAKRA
jgi:hypothetical protein